MQEQGVTVVIPARYASHRLPGKALADIDGLPMVVRVMQIAERAERVSRVLVATDDPRIAMAVADHGGTAIRSARAHRTGTDRVAAVVAQDPDIGLVINLQGDEPLLEPSVIDAVAERLQAGREAVVTAATPLLGAPDDPASVKLVFDAQGRALYFSRAPIPHGGPHWLHLGLYGFTRAAIARFTALPTAELERTERLEQLRLLAAGVPVHVAAVHSASISVDCPADLLAVRQRLSASA